MQKKVFSDYYMTEEASLKGYTVTNVGFGVNEKDTGMLIELEREIANATLGIDIFYDPDNKELEESFKISQEYVKHIREV